MTRHITISSDYLDPQMAQGFIAEGADPEAARGRRQGKSTAAANLVIDNAVKHPGSKNLYREVQADGSLAPYMLGKLTMVEALKSLVVGYKISGASFKLSNNSSIDIETDTYLTKGVDYSLVVTVKNN